MPKYEKWFLKNYPDFTYLRSRTIGDKVYLLGVDFDGDSIWVEYTGD